jgi:hypothetical protein
MNKPASLTAGVCSLCITATMVAVPPHAAAAELPAIQHRSVSVLDQPYELTAASQALQNLLLVAGIPFNNLNTTLTTIGGLTNFVTGLNQALGNIYKGNWDLVPANLQKAWTDEVAAFQKVLQLPQTLIAYNAKTIQNFIGSLDGGDSSFAGRSLAPTALATAQSDVTNALLVVLGIPFNNLNTTLTTLGGLTNFVTGLNQALGNIYKGNWDLVPANLQKAWTDEVAALQKVLQLPRTLITYNIQALQNLVGNLAPASASTFVMSERIHTLALPAALEGATPTTADEVPVIESEDDSDAAAAVDATETVDAVDAIGVEDSTETADEVDTTVPEAETVTDTTLTTDAPAEDAAKPVTEEASEKPSETITDGDTDKTADTNASEEGPTYGKHALQDGASGATYGKHALKDDTAESASSASADESSAASGPGRHRKAESDSEGSSASTSSSSSTSSSTSGSSAAA